MADVAVWFSGSIFVYGGREQGEGFQFLLGIFYGDILCECICHEEAGGQKQQQRRDFLLSGSQDFVFGRRSCLPGLSGLVRCFIFLPAADGRELLDVKDDWVQSE